MKTLFNDGPAVYTTINVTDTPQELKVGASPLEERKFVIIQTIGNADDEPIYIGFDNTVTSSTGFCVFLDVFFSLQASCTLPIWLVAEAGKTVETRIGEIA